MSPEPMDLIRDRLRAVNAGLLKLSDRCTEAQLAWSPGPTAPPIRWHLWHIARWADRVQELLSQATPVLRERLGAGRQIWHAEELAGRWGLDPAALGEAESGMRMDAAAAVGLPLAPGERVRGYARRAFAAVERAAAAVDAEQFAVPCLDLYGRTSPVGLVVLSQVTHANRHLGMVEALVGVQGSPGTATA